jgi:Bacterial SH3 domain
MKKFQNMEAIIVVFVMIFVLMVLIPRCRKNPAAETTAVVPPVATPQALPTEPAAAAPATETAATPATVPATAPATTPAPAVVPAPAPTVAAAEKVTSPEAFARKLTPKPMTTKTQRATPAANGETTVPFNPDGGGTAESGSSVTLYTVVSDVKMRSEPGLNSKIIGKLPKDAAVTYLRVQTDKTQKLTIDNVPHDEPWLKVRTKRGTVGWVYGGTVRAYKK